MHVAPGWFKPWLRRKRECIVIDDAQDLNLAHLAFLKELTDNLAAPPNARQVGLCLVTAHTGMAIPLKEIFSRPDTLWRQFRRRLDTERPDLGGARAHRGGSAFDPGGL